MGRLDHGAWTSLRVFLADQLDDFRQPRLERLLAGEPDRDRVNIEEIVHVAPEPLLELVVDPVAGAVPDQCAKAQPHLARLPQEEGDVGIVSGVKDDIRAFTLELDHERRQVGRRRGIALVDDDIESCLLGAFLNASRHVDAVCSVLVDDGDTQVVRRLAKLLLRIGSDESGRGQAELAPARLRAEDVFQMAVLKHGRRNAGGDPHEFLHLIHARGDGHALRRGEKAQQDIDLLLLDQPHRLVDGNLRLALRIGVDRLDLITFDPAVFVEIVDHDLGAERVKL